MRKLIAILVIAAAAAGCDRHRNHPGWDYFPDMFYSTAYETYTTNPNFADSMTQRIPPDGSVAREHLPFVYTTAAESRVKAGMELVNPVSATPENIARGEEAYRIFCLQCHGPSGNGDGFLFTSGLYPLKPRPVTGQSAPLRDGEIYHTITLGYGSMGPHGSQVRPDDRWKIILYIRQMQQGK